MAGLSLRCGDCGVQLRSVEEAQAHAEATSHTNFAESDEAVLNLICAGCGKPCRSQTEVDLHTKRTGHAEFTDKTMEAAKPIDLEAPLKPVSGAMDVDASGSGESQEMVAPEVNKEMLADLQSMGFSMGRATRALHFSGNSTIEGVINWLSEHQEDPDIDEMPMVPATSNAKANKPSLTPEEKKIKAQELRERARKKKEEEEKRMEREREKERIRIGKELLEAKRMEEVNERKRIIELSRGWRRLTSGILILVRASSWLAGDNSGRSPTCYALPCRRALHAAPRGPDPPHRARIAGGGAAAAAARMDPEAATELARKGVTLLLLDVPQHTVLGLDTQVFSVGPRFKGIKMAPPGPHFVYYCSPSRHGSEFAPTVGFFLTTHPSEVVVRKWHAQEERLVKLSEEEEIRYSEAVKRFEFDDQLGPYNLDSYGDWKQLSSYLSQSVIERLEPIGGEITIALETSWMDRAPQTDMERRLMGQLREDKFAKISPAQPERRGCYYTTIPSSVKHKNISANELTLLNLDRTSLLESVLAKSYQDQEDLLLGELQFSFIAFMMGQSLEAFMQWKALVSLLLSCSEAPLHARTQMFVKFIRVIYYQFKHGFQRTHDSRSSEDKGNSLFLDEAWFSRDIFLYRLSKDFLTVILEAPVVDGDLLSWARKLKTLLETTFGWDLENSAANLIDEDDEFAPVVVEMDGSS